MVMKSKETMQAMYQIALEMGETELVLTIGEALWLGQLCVALNHVGLYDERHSEECAKAIFTASKDAISGIEGIFQKKSTSEIVTIAQRRGIPDLKIKLKVVGVMALVGALTVMKEAIYSLLSTEDESRRSLDKLMELGRRVSLEVIRRAHEHGLDLSPNHAPAKA
jgi:hypothetical protein